MLHHHHLADDLMTSFITEDCRKKVLYQKNAYLIKE